MTVLPIYVQDRPGAPRELWAYRQGTRAEIEKCAQDFLESMIENGDTKARVWIGKTLVKRERKP